MNGLILTGGKSSRMGRDKAEIVYRTVPQWRRLEEMLRPFCEEVYWSCTPAQAERWGIGARALVDKTPFQGPAEGMRLAFERGGSWLVVACDYPYLEETDLQCLVAGRAGGIDAVAFQGEEVEPLLSVWEQAAQRYLEDSPRRALQQCRLRLVTPKTPRALTNVNEQV